jgi:dihydropteroate synthase
MRKPEGLTVRGRHFAWGTQTYLMGIVNVTPDSFSGDGRIGASAAIDHAMTLWEQGADILDIGGESTRPGHQRLDPDEETARVVPVIRGVRERLPHAPVSVDTYKPEVARAAHDAGADVLNSIWGAPDGLLDVAAERTMPLIAMHNQAGTQYDGDPVDGIVAFLADAVARSSARGVMIVLDPGIGFGKTQEQNVHVLQHLQRIVALGYPTLLGASRKSMIGKLTGKVANERISGTGATTALAIAAGIDIVRVHDVVETRDVIAVSDAIVRGWRPSSWTV